MEPTLAQAKIIWENRANGGAYEMSQSKGGRIWLEGEFRLAELEALCIVLREHAGEWAEGLKELLKNSE